MTSGAPGGRLWVARHAPVADGAICYGRTDVAVQIDPARAAETLLASYRGEKPRHVWSSPASRCRNVAEHLAAMLGAPLTVNGALAELDFGTWEGRTWTSIQTDDRPHYEAWMNDWQTLAPPRGERPADIEARVREWLRAVPGDAAHCLVAHSGVVRALSVVIEKASWPDAMRRQVPHLSWVEFSIDATSGSSSAPDTQ
jgi:alpha-ribazole phosphatase